jgi:REP element-mobilizing transposase RayT
MPSASRIVSGMRYKAELDHRRSTRLAAWDYRDSGAYFVTICSDDRVPLFGRFVGEELVLNQFGAIVTEVWSNVVGEGPGEFVVMPNHVHGIVWIQREPGRDPKPPVGVEQLMDPQTTRPSVPSRPSMSHVAVAQPLRPEFISVRRGLRDGLERGSLFVLVRSFKSAVAKRINTLRRTPGAGVWQRNYYDRIVRDDRELDGAREYILDNPRRWAEDKHNPSVFSGKHVTPGASVGIEQLGRPTSTKRWG